jgi:hypothetical protein
MARVRHSARTPPNHRVQTWRALHGPDTTLGTTERELTRGSQGPQPAGGNLLAVRVDQLHDTGRQGELLDAAAKQPTDRRPRWPR